MQKNNEEELLIVDVDLDILNVRSQEFSRLPSCASFFHRVADQNSFFALCRTQEQSMVFEEISKPSRCNGVNLERDNTPEGRCVGSRRRLEESVSVKKQETMFALFSDPTRRETV